jgi:peptidoglycan/xylan/chitin deacetylase (PgdA/CDA1 family)
MFTRTIALLALLVGFVISLPLPALAEGMVTLNFDDGTRGHWDVARPMLVAAGKQATFYIVTGRVGNNDALSRDEIIQLRALGHEIGVHTRTHRDLSAMSPAEWINEIIGSLVDTIDIVSIADWPFTFAYPFGVYNNDIATLVGWLFAGGRTTDGGLNNPAVDRTKLRRRGVERTTTVSQVIAWIQEAIATNQWLILVFHRIDNSGERFSTTPGDFQAILDYLRQNPTIPVVTTKQGIAIMYP